MTTYPHLVRDESWDLPSSGRVVQGLGSVARLGELLGERGGRHALIVTDPGLASTGLVGSLEQTIEAAGLAVSVHSEIPPNPSTDAVDRAAGAARDCAADVVVAFGGGSALDAAKAVALLAPSGLRVDALLAGGAVDAVLPIAAVPTTAGTGAETNGFGVIESADHRKVYVGSDRTVPALVVLDAALTVGLPAPVTAASGFDAVIHGAESLLSRRATTLSRAYATESLRLTTSALVRAVEHGDDLEARTQMMIGAHLAGRALTLSGLGVVHGIGHSITATTGAPHGVAMAPVAASALLLGIDASPAAYADLARALGLDVDLPEPGRRAVAAIADLGPVAGLPTSVAQVGVTPGLVGTIVTKTLDDPVTANSPRRPSAADLVELLTRDLASA